MVCPGIKDVLPLGIEPIIKQDGAIKNDCEINAVTPCVKMDHVKT